MKTTKHVTGIRRALLGMAVPLFVWAGAARATLITNGSFENHGAFQTDQWSSGYGGLLLENGTDPGPYTSTAALPGWLATRTDQNQWAWLMNNNFSGVGTPPDGNNVLNFTTTAESIDQSFSVAGGAVYSISYFDKYRTDSGSTMQAIASIDGGFLTLGTWTRSEPTGSGTSTLTQTTTAESAWTDYTFTFIPSQAGTVTLTFQPGSLASDGIYLDNVSVTQLIPEPDVFALLGIGGLVLWWRRKNRE